MVASALPADHHVRVISGRGNHTEDFARRWLDSHDAPHLSFHQPLAECLQFNIDAQREVFPRNGMGIEPPVLITALNASAGISKQDVLAFHAPQFLFVITLYAELADIVARLIIIVFFNIRLRHLRHVAQHMGGIGIFVLADAALLDIETWEAEHFLLKHTELRVGQLAHEQLLRIA